MLHGDEPLKTMPRTKRALVMVSEAGGGRERVEGRERGGKREEF